VGKHIEAVLHHVSRCVVMRVSSLCFRSIYNPLSGVVCTGVLLVLVAVVGAVAFGFD